MIHIGKMENHSQLSTTSESSSSSLRSLTEIPADSTNSAGFTVVRVLLILVGVIGITGNSLVLFVLLRIIKRHKRNQTYWLIGNQCAADMFSSVQMILIQIESFSPRWQPPAPNTVGGALYCFLWTTQIFMFGSFVVSSFNLTILSLERFFAVVYPQIYIAKLKRSFCYVGLGAWLYAPIMQYITVGLHFTYVDGECVYMRGSPALGVLLFVWEFFIPVTIMTFCFFRVSRKFSQLNKIQHSWNKQNGEPTQSNRDDTVAIAAPSSDVHTLDSRAAGPSMLTANPDISTNDKTGGVVSTTKSTQDNFERKPAQTPSSIQRRNSTLTLFIVYIAYVLCWTLNQFSFLVYNLGGPLDFGGVYYRFALIMATSNSCINVFIYSFRFKMFQQGMKSIFTKA